MGPEEIEKSDGDGNIYSVPNPDYYIDNNEVKHKIRKRPTNITPKKQKRKK